MSLESQVLEVMQKAVDSSLVAGVNLLVEQGEKEILDCQAGLADRESEKPIQRDTIYRLYSQSKPVTATAAMILMERGEIDLCQTVGEILPSYRNMKVFQADGKARPAEKPLLIHNLLGMTSGLSYPDAVTPSGKMVAVIYEEACNRLGTDNEMSTVELADRLAEVPLAYEPGTSWQYGTSADVLGAVVEKVSGKKLADFMADEIFKPLGMKDTAFWVPAEKQHRLAKVYETVWNDGAMDMIPYTGHNLAIYTSFNHEPAYAAGGAGLASTLDDYMKFARMLRNHGRYEGGQLLKPKTVEFMTGADLMPCQQVSFDNWIGLSGFSYGNLMRICKRPGQAGMIASEGEYGWDGWTGNYITMDPSENMTLLYFIQKTDAGTTEEVRKLRVAAYASL